MEKESRERGARSQRSEIRSQRLAADKSEDNCGFRIANGEFADFRSLTSGYRIIIALAPSLFALCGLQLCEGK
jgi:hypothetical protein